MKKNKKNKYSIFCIVIGSYFFAFSVFLFYINYVKKGVSLLESIMFSVFIFFGILTIIECVKILTKKPKCKSCGCEIKNLEIGCNKKINKFLKEVERTEYDEVISTTTSTTEHLRGGYSPRNVYGPNPTSETKTTTVTKIPKKIIAYQYKVDYVCKNCGKVYKSRVEESTEKIK
ncbi:MAG: hypothetical protein R3Y13_01965 [bacterium]